MSCLLYTSFLEFYGLGDTCGVIELMDHSVEMVTDSVLEALDDKVIRRCV